MRVRTPVEGYAGYVVGVTFVNGGAEVPDDHPALAYFRRQGYIRSLSRSRRRRAPVHPDRRCGPCMQT